jgi:hypothetical protein
MKKPLTRISGLPKITPLFEIKEDQDVKGVVRPNLGILPFLFPLSPSIFKIPTGNIHFSSEGPSCLLTFGLIFLLDSVFPLFYALPIKKELLIKQGSFRVLSLLWISRRS